MRIFKSGSWNLVMIFHLLQVVLLHIHLILILCQLLNVTSSMAERPPAQFKIKSRLKHPQSNQHLPTNSHLNSHSSSSSHSTKAGGISKFLASIKPKQNNKEIKTSVINHKKNVHLNTHHVHFQPHLPKFGHKGKDKNKIIPSMEKIQEKIKSNLTLDSTTMKILDEQNEFLFHVREKMEERADEDLCNFEFGIRDARLTTPQILKKLGLPCETHVVKTKDGYLIEIHRMPRPGNRVVLAMPGIFQSSRDFLINCRGRSLGEKLYDANYDTWLTNYRGNTYGRHHTRLSPDRTEFWNFSGDDFAHYDLPALIDTILKKTNQSQLNFVGNSMGNAILFGLLSQHPEYNEKIHLGLAMGPAFYFGNTRSPLLRTMARNRGIIIPFIRTFFRGEVFPPKLTGLLHFLMPILCSPEAILHEHGFCTFAPSLIDGNDPDETNHVTLPLFFGGFPSPTSWRVISQWFQGITSGRAEMYDYGFVKNLIHYGSPRPPIYNLSNVVAPIVLFFGDNDFITSKRDSLKLAAELPNLVGLIRVKYDKWTHVDNAYGKDSDIFVYDYMLKFLEKSYEAQNSKDIDNNSFLTV